MRDREKVYKCRNCSRANKQKLCNYNASWHILYCNRKCQGLNSWLFWLTPVRITLLVAAWLFWLWGVHNGIKHGLFDNICWPIMVGSLATST